MDYTFLLGSNEITNCKAVLVVNGVEIFRLRERIGDNQLVVDFEIRDDSNKLIFKVAKNNVVHARTGLKIRHMPYFSEVYDENNDHTIAKAEEISLGKIQVTGNFNIDGKKVVLSGDRLIVNTNMISGNKMDGCGKGIVIEGSMIALGAS